MRMSIPSSRATRIEPGMTTTSVLPTVPALAAMIDHAVLKPTQTERGVVDACTIARREVIASVCVKPFYVPDRARLPQGSGVRTSTVVGLPHGGQSPEVKVSTSLQALRDGATELDMVINIGALIERDYATIEREIASVVGVGHASEAIVKVILETAYLDDAQKAIAAQIAQAAGADFVKTSTGSARGRDRRGRAAAEAARRPEDGCQGARRDPHARRGARDDRRRRGQARHLVDGTGPRRAAPAARRGLIHFVVAVHRTSGGGGPDPMGSRPVRHMRRYI